MHKPVERFLLLALLAAPVMPAAAETRRDAIGDLIRTGGETRLAQSGTPQAAPAPSGAPHKQPPPAPAATAEAPPDPRAGDPVHEQAQRLMKAVEAVLNDTARQRGEARKLPSKDDFILPPVFTETREDRERKIRNLLDAALGIVTDVPVVDMQRRIEALRKNIRELSDRIVKLRERQLTAPKEGFLPGIITDTVDSLEKEIVEANKKIELNRGEIARTKDEVGEALKKSGVELSKEQIDLLLDGVLSGDLVRLVAVFNSAKVIDAQLGRLLTQSGENVRAARRYFAMHAALFALLVHAQDQVIAKIDNKYLPKLDAIAKDIANARAKTQQLLRAENRPDQRRVLEANRDSQKLADDAARGYRRYLQQQRDQIARARAKAIHDLKIADNTYETVEASYQLRRLMRDSQSSFEAIQRLEAPTFEQIFRNEELRREFESLTRKLDAPTS